MYDGRIKILWLSYASNNFFLSEIYPGNNIFGLFLIIDWNLFFKVRFLILPTIEISASIFNSLNISRNSKIPFSGFTLETFKNLILSKFGFLIFFNHSAVSVEDSITYPFFCVWSLSCKAITVAPDVTIEYMIW